MGICRLCGFSGKTVSNVIGVCANCLRKNSEALAIAMETHKRYRESIGLPLEPPRDPSGVRCKLCVNECSIPDGCIGFCGIWKNDGGMLKFIENNNYGILYSYLDPLPTNCVATPVCPASTGVGYPKYAALPSTEYGYYNLAIFFAGCNLNCIFCQNWQHKDIATLSMLRKKYLVSIDELIKNIIENKKITCICFFGGDPTPHIVHSIEMSKKIIAYSYRYDVVKRICWETNGLENPVIMKEMAKLSLESGGIVKIDWKAFTPQIYQALTGINGFKAIKRVKDNIRIVADIAKERKEIPLLVVSILLVPGYIDEAELKGIAEYIASVDRDTPIVLLAFHADHLLRDLPPTSISHAQKAYRIFKNHGIEKIFIGNEWLLGSYY